MAIVSPKSLVKAVWRWICSLVITVTERGTSSRASSVRVTVTITLSGNISLLPGVPPGREASGTVPAGGGVPGSVTGVSVVGVVGVPVEGAVGVSVEGIVGIPVVGVVGVPVVGVVGVPVEGVVGVVGVLVEGVEGVVGVLVAGAVLRGGTTAVADGGVKLKTKFWLL